jgi:glycosyltransferase involved in cell wall biosynthesis
METVVMNYFRNIQRDEIMFDFVVHGEKGHYEDEAAALGARIFRAPTRSQGFFKSILAMRKIYKAHPEYDCVIVCTEHAFAFIELAIAWFCGVKTRAAWSHFSDYQGRSRLKRRVHFFARPFLRLFANMYLACTKDAGYWLFGKNFATIVNNAINLDKFKFSQEARDKIREKHKLDGGKYAIGMVGRLVHVKNHAFALEVLAKIRAAEAGKDTVMLIIGDGELKNQLVANCHRLKISESVIFTGAAENIHEYYQALDLLLIPSFHEGLTLAAVEAQASGLPVLLSDTVSPDTKISELASFKSQADGAESWADAIFHLKAAPHNRTAPDLSDSGFEIKAETKKLQKILKGMI